MRTLFVRVKNRSFCFVLLLFFVVALAAVVVSAVDGGRSGAFARGRAVGKCKSNDHLPNLS